MPRIVDRPGRTRCCDLFLGNVEYRNQRPFCLISRQPRTVQYHLSMYGTNHADCGLDEQANNSLFVTVRSIGDSLCVGVRE